ncbi:hypothetical protein GMMP1_40076 [Candidatus Magnetomoraceae bacterium gMMP-1]
MDEIITEVRKIREEYVAEHDYNLDKIFADLKEKEASSNKRLIDLRYKHKKEIQKRFPLQSAAEPVAPAHLQGF